MLKRVEYILASKELDHLDKFYLNNSTLEELKEYLKNHEEFYQNYKIYKVTVELEKILDITHPD